MNHVIVSAFMQLILFFSPGTIYAQVIPSSTISDFLSQFTNADVSVRQTAFYGLLAVGTGPGFSNTAYSVPLEIQRVLKNVSEQDAESIKLSLASLLATENTFVAPYWNPTDGPGLSEAYTEYYADLVTAVVTLNDQRTIPSLIGALRLGDISRSAIAAFGDASIDQLVAQLDGSDSLNAFSTVMALEEMLDADNFSRISFDTKEKLRQALIFASSFSDVGTAAEATQALAKLNSLAQVDTTPPITGAVVSPAENGTGWNDMTVTVNLSSIDNANGSGVKQITFGAAGAAASPNIVVPGNSFSFPISTEGVTTITFFAMDNAGNVETAKTLAVKIDKTAPTILDMRTPQPNANGWNNTNVTVSFQCADALSGLASGSPPAPTTLSTEGAGQSVAATCTDVAGNSASVTVSSINIDKTPPIIACSASPDVLWPPSNRLVPINVSMKVSDALSGPGGFTLVSVTSNEPDSGQGDIQSFVTGTASISGQLRATRLGSGTGRVYTLTYSGSDRAGNTATCTTTVSVPHDQGQN